MTPARQRFEEWSRTFASFSTTATEVRERRKKYRERIVSEIHEWLRSRRTDVVVTALDASVETDPTDGDSEEWITDPCDA